MKKSAFIIFLSFLFVEALSAENMLVNVSDDDTGTCANGGKKIEVGTDEDGNGALDENNEFGNNEITKTEFVCNGADGENGTSPVVSVAVADVSHCSGIGGIVVTVGDDELPVCNGQAGTNALIKTTELSGESNECNCDNGNNANGCIKIEAGLDNKNPNGTLDANEVTKTEYVCNGANGKTGNNALSKITEITNETTDCKNGGVKIEVGVDADGNGILDENEIDNTQTKFVCNGANGKNGGNGPAGPKGEDGENGKDGAPGEQGEKGETGAKGDQGIQGETGAKGENGTDGISSLVAVVDEPKGENCVTGGKKISVGLDSNRNGTLDEDEIDPESVYYVCNGRDAEEAGLSSSSTGCSLTTVDENETLISVVFALLTAVSAAFALKKVRS